MSTVSFPEEGAIQDILRRLSALETAPRAGNTTIEPGELVGQTWRSGAAYTGHMITYDTTGGTAASPSTAWVAVCSFRSSIPLASIRSILVPVHVQAAGVADVGDVRITQSSRFVLGDQIGISVGAIGFGATGAEYTIDVAGVPIADSEFLRVAFDVEVRRTAGGGSVSARCDTLALVL